MTAHAQVIPFAASDVQSSEVSWRADHWRNKRKEPALLRTLVAPQGSRCQEEPGWDIGNHIAT